MQCQEPKKVYEENRCSSEHYHRVSKQHQDDKAVFLGRDLSKADPVKAERRITYAVHPNELHHGDYVIPFLLPNAAAERKFYCLHWLRARHRPVFSYHHHHDFQHHQPANQITANVYWLIYRVYSGYEKNIEVSAL
jgi:hypothetical protein